jgi:DNA-3-methyladenine glycosylase
LLGAPTLEAAGALLGARLVHGERAGRIVEVEAYIGRADRASHARFGRTERNAPMFGPPGHAYVYLVYGMHRCLNVVTEAPDAPAAVLIRAVEPLAGLCAMRDARVATEATRGVPAGLAPDPVRLESIRRRIDRVPEHRLAAGPGLVGAAFGLDLADSGRDLLDPGSDLRLEEDPGAPPFSIVRTPRIGVAYAGPEWAALPWRLLIEGHPCISVKAGRR